MAAIIDNGMCRCCASEGSFKDLRSVYHWMDEQEVYADMLQECLDITLSSSENGNNGGICELCITQLRNASNFKRQVLQTEQRFVQLISDGALKLDVKLEDENKDTFDSQESDHDIAEDFSAVEFEAPPIKEEDEIEEPEGPKTRKRAAKASTSKAKKAKKDAAETSSKSCLIGQNSSKKPPDQSGIFRGTKVKHFATMVNSSSKGAMLIRYKPITENNERTKTLLISQFARTKDNRAAVDHDHNYNLSHVIPFKSLQKASVRTTKTIPAKLYEKRLDSEECVSNESEDNVTNGFIPCKSPPEINLLETSNEEFVTNDLQEKVTVEFLKCKSPSEINLIAKSNEEFVKNDSESNVTIEFIKCKSPFEINLHHQSNEDDVVDDDSDGSSETDEEVERSSRIKENYDDSKHDPDYIPEIKTTKNKPNVYFANHDIKIKKALPKTIPEYVSSRLDDFGKECTLIFRNSNMTPLVTSSGIGFTCAYCSERFLIAANLKVHTINFHVNPGSKRTLLNRKPKDSDYIRVDITNLKCKLCEFPCDSVNLLISHLNSAHDKNIDVEMENKLIPFKFTNMQYICCLCPLELFTFKALSLHTIQTHYKNYFCDTCGLGFVTKTVLINHLKKGHKSNEPKASNKCDVCEKEFRSQHFMRKHKYNVHSIGTPRQMKCQVCAAVFKTRSQRAAHLFKEHQIDYSLNCNICKKSYTNAVSLKSHIDSIHLKKKFHCEICGMQLANRSSLGRHLVLHESGAEKKFQCDVCKKFYSTKHNLVDHMTIHTKKFKFQCEQCGQKFRQNIALKNHVKSKHANDTSVTKKRKKNKK